jgi:hypothetical protein
MNNTRTSTRTATYTCIRTSTLKTTVLSAAVLAALHGNVVHAQVIAEIMPDTRVVSHVGQSVQLTVHDRNTRVALPIYYHRGEYWVAGTPKQGYTLNLRSTVAGRRALATTSVDGINVVSGETAALLGRGYVLSPYVNSSIAGWRKGEYEVAAFNFAAPQGSYAAQTGRPGNVGVIGVAVFPEAIAPPRPPAVPVSPPVYLPMPLPLPVPLPAYGSQERHDRYEKSGVDSASGAAAAKSNSSNASSASSTANAPDADAVSPAPAAASVPLPVPETMSASKMKAEPYHGNNSKPIAPPAAAGGMVAPAPSEVVRQGIGTQHGERLSSYAPTVAFQREGNSPAEVISLRYDTVDNLVARGVLRWVQVYPQPQPLQPHAFPRHVPHGGYVPDPPRQW